LDQKSKVLRRSILISQKLGNQYEDVHISNFQKDSSDLPEQGKPTIGFYRGYTLNTKIFIQYANKDALKFKINNRRNT